MPAWEQRRERRSYAYFSELRRSWSTGPNRGDGFWLTKWLFSVHLTAKTATAMEAILAAMERRPCTLLGRKAVELPLPRIFWDNATGPGLSAFPIPLSRAHSSPLSESYNYVLDLVLLVASALGRVNVTTESHNRLGWAGAASCLGSSKAWRMGTLLYYHTLQCADVGGVEIALANRIKPDTQPYYRQRARLSVAGLVVDIILFLSLFLWSFPNQ